MRFDVPLRMLGYIGLNVAEQGEKDQGQPPAASTILYARDVENRDWATGGLDVIFLLDIEDIHELQFQH